MEQDYRLFLFQVALCLLLMYMVLCSLDLVDIYGAGVSFS